MSGPSLSDMQGAFVEAYIEAARSGADMRAAVNSIEAIKDMIAGGAGPYSIWAKFDESVGLADLQCLMPILAKLSRRWEQLFTGHEIARIKQAFSQSREQGWTTWLQAYTSTFDSLGWRTRFAMALTAEALEWSPDTEWPLERIRNSVDMVFRTRWGEAYDWFLFLGRQELLGERRVTFLVCAAEIHLFHFEQLSKTVLYTRQAEEIAKEDAYIKRVSGELYAQQGDLDQAKEYFQKLIQQKPNDADGFTGLGDVHDQAGDTNEAESQYQQAIANAPGMGEGYRRLLRFHGKPVWFANRSKLLAPLVERMKALSDWEESAYVELGVIYDTNGLFQEARSTYKQALDVDKRSLMALTYLGYSYLDEAANVTDGAAELWDQARAAFARAIEVGPRALDGYWGMGGVAIAEKNWASVLEWCDRGLKCHPEWESKVRTRRANALGQIGRVEDAELDLEKSLALEPKNPQAISEYWNLVDVCHSLGKLDMSRRLLEKWRSLSGPSAEDLFQNKLGNWSLEAGDYVTAVSLYRLAIAAKVDDPVLHSNLALALELSKTEGRRLEEMTEAVAELRQALGLNPQSADYRERLEKYDTERALLEAYGEKASAFEPMVTPIRVDIADIRTLLNEVQKDLSAATRSTVEEFRMQFREDWGITTPGILFGILDNSSPGAFRTTLLARHVYDGLIDEGAEPLTAVLKHLRSLLEIHMGDFVGHDAASEILKGAGTPAAAQISKASLQLTRFVQLLRALLARRIPVTSVDTICDAFAKPDALKELVGASGGAT